MHKVLAGRMKDASGAEVKNFVMKTAEDWRIKKV
jgi:hypothetical protein